MVIRNSQFVDVHTYPRTFQAEARPLTLEQAIDEYARLQAADREITQQIRTNELKAAELVRMSESITTALARAQRALMDAVVAEGQARAKRRALHAEVRLDADGGAVLCDPNPGEKTGL